MFINAPATNSENLGLLSCCFLNVENPILGDVFGDESREGQKKKIFEDFCCTSQKGDCMIIFGMVQRLWLGRLVTSLRPFARGLVGFDWRANEVVLLRNGSRLVEFWALFCRHVIWNRTY